jgi:hypothetical protein
VAPKTSRSSTPLFGGRVARSSFEPALQTPGVYNQVRPEPRFVACGCATYLDEPIALLKLDIEGVELVVLRDCADRLDGVDRLFVEFYSSDGQEQGLDEVVAILAGAGFRLHVVSELASRQPFVERTSYLGMDLQLNIYAFRE